MKQRLIDVYHFLNEFDRNIPVGHYVISDELESGKPSTYITFLEEPTPRFSDNKLHLLVFKITVNFVTNNLDDFKYIDFLNYMGEKHSFDIDSLDYDDYENTLNLRISYDV